MKSIVLAILFLALTSCTPKDINQAKTQLDSALQQRDLTRQVTILNTLAQHQQQWQQQAQQAQQAEQLLHQARQQYEQGAFVEAQLTAAKSKALNNSFQIDDLLRELGTQYPLTELVNELRQLHSETSRSQLSLQAFFDLPVSDWSIVDLNKKLMLINQAIANVNKHISAASTAIAHTLPIKMYFKQRIMKSIAYIDSNTYYLSNYSSKLVKATLINSSSYTIVPVKKCAILMNAWCTV